MLQDMHSFFDNVVAETPVKTAVKQSDTPVSLPTLEELNAQYPNTMLPVTAGVPNVVNIFYHNLTVAGYNLDELRAALDEQESALILSCAGSGKTTFMVLKLIHDYLTGVFNEEVEVKTPYGVQKQTRQARVFVSTFLKTGAEELREAFERQCIKLQVHGIVSDNITFSTLHAEYYAILRGLNVPIQLTTDEENNEHLHNAVRHLGIKSHDSNGSSKDLTAEGFGDIACIMTYARGRIDEQKYKHPLMSSYTMNAAILEKLIEMCKKQRQAVGKYDFEDLQEVIYNGIKGNPAFAEMIGQRYKYVYIDEFQDTSQVQYEILKTYIAHAKRTIVIGDDDQCIYSWRGSDVNIIAHQFEQDWHPKVHLFTMNYRCGSNILAAIAPSIARNSSRHDKPLRAYNTGGDVTVHDSEDVDLVLQEIKTALQQKQTVGVLGRTNFDLLAPAILLEFDGTIPFSLSKAVGITGAVPRQVLGCIKLITRRYTEEFEDLLRLFAGREARYGAGKFEASAVARVLHDNRELSLKTMDPDDLKTSCPNLWENLVQKMRTMPTDKDVYVYMLKYLYNNQYRSDTPFNARARMFCTFVLDLVLHNSKVQNMSISDLDELFTDILPTRLTKRAYANTGKRKSENIQVHLATVHEAKGKEWDSVILWNDTDGAFPAKVGTHNPTQEEFEEERRLHYIAFTRARKRLVVFTDSRKPSPFLRECNLVTNTESRGVQTQPTQILTHSRVVTREPDEGIDFLMMLTEARFSEDKSLNTAANNLCTYYEGETRAAEEVQHVYTEMQDGGELEQYGEDAQACFNAAVTKLLFALAFKEMEQAKAAGTMTDGSVV